MVIAQRVIATHAPVTVSDTDTVDLSLAGQALSAVIKAGSIDTTHLADDAVSAAKLDASVFAGTGTAETVAHSDHTHSGVYAPTVHNHDDRYYTESEVDAALALKSPVVHNHDSRYYTETETDAKYRPIAALPYLALTSFAEQSNGNASTAAVFIADTNITSGVLPSGTWAGLVILSGQMKKAASGNANVYLYLNGSLLGSSTIPCLTTYQPFRVGIYVSGLSGGTTPQFGVRFTATGGTQYMSMVSVNATFERTA